MSVATNTTSSMHVERLRGKYAAFREGLHGDGTIHGFSRAEEVDSCQRHAQRSRRLT